MMINRVLSVCLPVYRSKTSQQMFFSRLLIFCKTAVANAVITGHNSITKDAHMLSIYCHLRQEDMP